MKMENLLNHPKGCSQLAFKLGRFTFSKDAPEKKIERKRMIDDNTTSKLYFYRLTMYKFINEDTGEVALEGEKPYKVADETYDFTKESIKMEPGCQLGNTQFLKPTTYLLETALV